MEDGKHYLLEMTQKVDRMNEKLDEVQQQAHHLSTQKKAAAINVQTGFEGIVASNLFTSTPVHSRVQPTESWARLDPAKQLQILQDVAAKHTKVSLDFEGLRHSILASQRASLLESVFGLDKSLGAREPEEQAYIRDILEENLELSRDLLDTMETYVKEHVKSMKLKVQGAKEFEKIRLLFPKLLKDYEEREGEGSEKDFDNTLKARKETLDKEERKLMQMKTLLQKLMISYPNLGLDNCDEAKRAKFREIFVKCGEPISTLRDK